ncbi:hypothetical protein OKW40_002447 [Paraburkholderia sp. RAU6.4a]
MQTRQRNGQDSTRLEGTSQRGRVRLPNRIRGVHGVPMPTESRSFPLLVALTGLIGAIAGLAPLVKEITSLVAAGHPSQTAITIVVQNLGASWVCGTKQLSGMTPCSPTALPQPPRQVSSSSPPTKPPSSKFPNKTLGSLEQQIPISQTPWTLQPAEIPRVIHFDMRIEARAEEVETRVYLITLRREDGAVCSGRFDIGGATSGLVAMGKSCEDNVPENQQHVYSVSIEPPSKVVAVIMSARAQRPD